jgi:class 3 adenylate cyclase
MRCSTCYADNPAAAKFCEACGASLVLSCPSCGHDNRPNSRFCVECGGQLGGSRPVADHSPRRAPEPSTYTPPHLAEKILASRSAVEGERKQVTVLFADIKGSTDLIRALDVEKAQRLLDGATKVMMDAVHRYEGTVSRVMGDGIMALFGAPIAHEDHAVRGCYAALALQDAMHRYAEQTQQAHGALVEARVGLNSGEVVVRLITDDLHMDYTAMGAAVHLASRLEQLAREGTCLLTTETLGLAEGYVQVRSVGPVAIKGLDRPVELFELVGASAARTRLQAMAARGLTRFVGRQTELVTIDRALERAQGGHGQLVALVGEPGVGKSRLVWEVTHSDRTQGWLVLESGSFSYGKATSYLPVIDLLKGYFKIQDRDDLREIREKVSGKLLSLDEALKPTLPALLALLDVPMDDASWQTLDPGQRRQLTLDAVKRLLLRQAREQPLLLMFEDLHWIDGETQALLDGMVESLRSARLLLLVRPPSSTLDAKHRHAVEGGDGVGLGPQADPSDREPAVAFIDQRLVVQPALDAIRVRRDSQSMPLIDRRRFHRARRDHVPATVVIIKAKVVFQGIRADEIVAPFRETENDAAGGVLSASERFETRADDHIVVRSAGRNDHVELVGRRALNERTSVVRGTGHFLDCPVAREHLPADQRLAEIERVVGGGRQSSGGRHAGTDCRCAGNKVASGYHCHDSLLSAGAW